MAVDLSEAYNLINAGRWRNQEEHAIKSCIDYGSNSLRLIGSSLRKMNMEDDEKQKHLVALAEVKSVNLLLQKMLECNRREQCADKKVTWQKLKSPYESSLQCGIIVNMQSSSDVNAFLNAAKAQFESRLKSALKKETIIKVKSILTAAFSTIREGKEMMEAKCFAANEITVTPENLKECFAEYIGDFIPQKMEEINYNSNLTLTRIVNLILIIDSPKARNASKKMIGVLNKYGSMKGFLPIRPLNTLRTKEVYQLSDAKRAATPYGHKIVVDINDEYACFLPVRMTKVFKNEKEFQRFQKDCRNKRMNMIYLGGCYNKVLFENKKK